MREKGKVISAVSEKCEILLPMMFFEAVCSKIGLLNS
jgi:hypothetical protein